MRDAASLRARVFGLQRRAVLGLSVKLGKLVEEGEQRRTKETIHALVIGRDMLYHSTSFFFAGIILVIITPCSHRSE